MERGQYVGINKQCNKWKDIEYFYFNHGNIGMIYEKEKNHQKGLNVLTTKDCHIISYTIN